MLGTTLIKPVDSVAFREAMRFCCDPANGVRMVEYADRYEVQERPEVNPDERKASVEEPVSQLDIEERLSALEKRVWGLEAQQK